MVIRRFSLILLWLLIAAGFYSALSLSYTTFSGTLPCPDVGGVPVCYVVTIGYAAMLLRLIGWYLFKIDKHSHRLFFSGWLIVFLIAAAATVMEIFKGSVCPSSNSGFPLCYLSLAYSVVIFVLYRFNLKNRT